MTQPSLATSIQTTEPSSSEHVIWRGAPSQLANFSAYALSAAVSLTVIGLLWGVPYAIWIYFSTKNTRYELTNQRLVLHAGVFTKTQEQVELYRVRDTKFIQPFFLRLFGVGNVLLISSDQSTPHVLLFGIEDAQHVMESVRRATETIRAARNVRVSEID